MSDQNPAPQNDSPPPKDHAGLIIGLVCLGLLLVVIVFNTSC